MKRPHSRHLHCRRRAINRLSGLEMLEDRRLLAALPVANDDVYSIDEDETLLIGAGSVTRLQLTSQPGDYIGQGNDYDFSQDAGLFMASRNFDDGVNVTFNGGAGNSWFLKFAAPGDVDLTPGEYLGATRWPFNASDEPGLSVTGQGRGCSAFTGEFTVHEAVYDASGAVDAFSAEFEQHCDGAAPALLGSIQVNASAVGDGLLVNDTDADGDSLTAVLVSGPANGSLTLNDDGTFSYTPNTNFNGIDTFSYMANDGTGDSNVATVTITVNPVNDTPLADDWDATTEQDTAIAGQLTASDVEGDQLTYSSVDLPDNGTLSLSDDGSFSYTPNAGFAGTDSFTFVANDGTASSNVGTVTIAVIALNQAPVAVDDFYSVDEDGVLVITLDIDTRLQMTSAQGDFVGQGQTYDFTEADGLFLAARNFDNGVNVTYNGGPGNSWFLNFAGPHATDLSPGVYASATRWPFNPDDEPGMSITGQGRGCNTLTGTFTVHQADYDAAGFVQAFAADFEQHCDGGEPALFGTIQVDGAISGGVLANDIDDDGDTLTAILVDMPSNGDVTLNPDGTFTYTPNADFSGSDSFTYKSSDGENDSNVATVYLTVNPLNDAPVVQDQTFTVFENAAGGEIVGAVLAADIDGDDLTYAITAGNESGAFTINSSTGEITVADPLQLDFETRTQYQLTVGVTDDGQGSLSDTATVLIDVQDVNDNAPVLTVNSLTVAEGQTVVLTTANLAATDVDSDVGTLTFAIFSLSRGAFRIDGLTGTTFTQNDIAGGRVTFVHDDSEYAPSYHVTVSDGELASSADSAAINFSNINDNAPVIPAGQLLYVSENASDGAPVGTVAFSDSDLPGDSLTVSIAGGDPQGTFAVGQAGDLTIADSTNLDFETTTWYDLTIEVFDGSNTTSQDVKIYVEPENDNPPEIPPGQLITVSEDATNGMPVGMVQFSDEDFPADSFQITIPAGNEDGVFAIDDAGELTIADHTMLDFETTEFYLLTVAIFDGIHTTSEIVAVEVLDVLEAVETKFFVVDTSVDSTFEYAADGEPVDNYRLGAGNNSPTGAAADVTGATVWVVDDDRYVYVYDAAGNSRVRWKTNGLSRPEGIATNGQDIWVVDSRYDRVYRFDDAAGFTSGSHTYSSQFKLASGNRYPKGITTDGTHLWIVDSAGTDKVFKYTVSGTLLGSWNLDSANSRPEGITIDPAVVDTIWVVDSAADAVFQYTGGTAWSSGTHFADDGFALASTNSNPRGIADPPPALQPSHTENMGVRLPGIVKQTARQSDGDQVKLSVGNTFFTAAGPLSLASGTDQSHDIAIQLRGSYGTRAEQDLDSRLFAPPLTATSESERRQAPEERRGEADRIFADMSDEETSLAPSLEVAIKDLLSLFNG